MKPTNRLSETFLPSLETSSQPKPLSWIWKDLSTQAAGSDEPSIAFQNLFLPTCRKAFYESDTTQNHLASLSSPLSINTHNYPFRAYHVGMEGFTEDTYVFIRNENTQGVDNWSIDTANQSRLNPGDFTEFKPKGYEPDYGGFLADIFTIQSDTLISSGVGTNAFADYTTSNTIIYAIKDSPCFYIELALGKTIRYGFALHVMEE